MTFLPTAGFCAGTDACYAAGIASEGNPQAMDPTVPLERLVHPSVFRTPTFLVPSAWHEHAPFLFWLLAVQRPRRYVELGTHHGFSYFAACQAVAEDALPTQCHAVDTWLGDEHAEFYGEEVFAAVRAQNDTHYRGFSTLVRATFAKAAKSFPDGTVDLLHIDGRHHYEDAAQDYADWLPKLAPGGIVLLHDTHVREREFGVWKLFAELAARHPNFDFAHGHGLGVVAPRGVPDALRPLFDADAATSDLVRGLYAALGDRITQRYLRIAREQTLADLAESGPKQQQSLSAVLLRKLRSTLRVLTREPGDALPLIVRNLRKPAVRRFPPLLLAARAIGLPQRLARRLAQRLRGRHPGAP